MATRKELTSYFPHDSNARNSDKLIRLRMRHKAAGYGVYFMILERLREEPEYTSVKDYNKEWRLKTNKVEKKLKLERKVLKKGGEIAKI